MDSVRRDADPLSPRSRRQAEGAHDANFSSTLILRDGHELIQHGPYRRVRHPMYTSFLVMLAGLFLLSANWIVGLPPILFVILLMLVRTPREERMLLGRFGDEYRRYRARTGRYLPRLRVH